MFRVTIGVQNKMTMNQIKDLVHRQQRGIRHALYFIGKDLVKDANKLILKKPKHGKLYKLKRLGRTINHRASAPGEAPANLSGSLRKSLDFDVIGSSRMLFGVKERFQNRKGIPSGVQYGGYLEEGTSKMEERPFLRPTIKKNYRNIKSHFYRQLKKYLEAKT